MAVLRYVGIGKETVAYGTIAAVQRYLEAIASLKPDQNWIIPTSIARRSAIKKNLGPYRTRGTIGDFSVEPENIGDLLMGAFGSVTTSNPATGVYEHIFKPADTLPSYTLRLGSEQTERILPGCLVNALTTRFMHGADVKARAEIFSGFVESKASLAAATFSALQPFVFQDASNVLTIATVNKKDVIYDIEFAIKNNIPFDRGDLSGRTFAKRRYGQIEATGKLSAYFDDATEYDRFIAGNEFALQLECYGPVISGGYKYLLKFYLPKCVYLRDVSPDITPTNEPLVVDAPFKAFYNSSDGYEIMAVLQNAVTGY